MRSAWPWLTLLLVTPALADYSGHPRAGELLQRLATEEHFSPGELDAVRTALAQAERLPQLVEAEQKAAERTETWTVYSTKRVDEARIERGADFIEEHRQTLAEAEAQFGVPAEVIAGVLGLETNFGRITGGARVLDALTTQGFEHPTRARFFFDELAQFFVFCRDSGWDPTELKGSYAGAMGWAQFMPSNYRRLAVDFDGDGRRDLWTAGDAIGSIARYLVDYDPQRAFRRGEPLAVPARLTRPLPAGFLTNLKQTSHTAGALKELGVEAGFELPPATPVGVLELTLDAGVEYWIGLHNFYSVMSYNPRTYYAMTVTQLAQAMARLDAQRAAEIGTVAE
ncbi:MAG: lytic murein transglycosylase [Panacagrimonas sp.]